MDTTERRHLRYEVNLLAFCLIIYTLITYLIVAGDLLLRIFLNVLLHNEFSERLVQTSPDSSLSEIIAVVVGVVFMAKVSKSRVRFSELFRTKKSMSFPVFMEILTVFCAFQLCSVWLDSLAEYCLNLIGFSLRESVAMATASSVSVTGLLYTCLAAPVAEELIYRGYCLHRLKEGTGVFPILVSAVLFGVMHANLPQMLFAFGVGLVLGFVTVEYSIVYAMILHFLNNFLFGDLLSHLCAPMPGLLYDTAFYFLFGTLFVCALIVLLYRRKEIAAYLRANRVPEGAYRATFFAALMIVFIIMNVVLGILLITPLGN